jgi:hypothetical protein
MQKNQKLTKAQIAGATPTAVQTLTKAGTFVIYPAIMFPRRRKPVFIIDDDGELMTRPSFQTAERVAARIIRQLQRKATP